MAYPISYKLAWWAEGLFEGSDFRDCQIGDSMSTEGGKSSQFGLGKARMWRVPTYVGECHRAGPQGPDGLYQSSGVSTQADFLGCTYQDTVWSSVNTSNCTATNPFPGSGSGSDGSSGWAINYSINCAVTGDPAENGTIYRCDFGGGGANKIDLNNWANGNPFTGEVTVRAIYRSKPNNNGFGGLKIGLRRDAATDGTPSGFTFASASGVAYAEYTRTSATNAASRIPGLLIAATSGVDSGCVLQMMGAAIYQSVSGVRKTGYYQSYIAIGSFTTENILAQLGGGASPLCLDLYIQGYLRDACLIPNRFTHWYGQNATSAESTEYASGGYSVFKANVRAILDKLDAQMAALGSTTHRHLLVSGYEGGTDAYNALRSRALYEIARERTNCSFISVHEIMPANPYPAALTITSITKANPAVVTTSTPHGLSSGQQINITGSNSSVSIDGQRIVTVTGPTTFTVPVDTSGGASAGTAGSFYHNPWWLHTDNIHPRSTGACIAAACLWNMIRAIRDANTYEYRREEIRHLPT